MTFRNGFKALASTRLTLVCLALAFVLVLWGTFAQVHLGLYEAQTRFFRSVFVRYGGVPVFPGGWLIGGVLVVNLIAGYLVRWNLWRLKPGLSLAHLGLLVLLVGQFFSEAFQVESRMRLEPDQPQNQLESVPDRAHSQLLYTLTLKEFQHELYPGSDIPKSYSSLIHLSNPATGEERDVLISMNNPLRYQGRAFYQSGFESDGDKTVSILQVVRNPVSDAPYVACAMIGLGLAWHFLRAFVRSRREVRS